MKTTVRVAVTVPDFFGTVQRLYDFDTFFTLEKENMCGHELADFICKLLDQGGRIIESHDFIDSDDNKTKTHAVFEYVTD